jgi:transposase
VGPHDHLEEKPWPTLSSLDAEAQRLRDAFRREQMRQPSLVEEAMGRQTLALLRQLDAACASADDLEAAAVESFNQHPDAGIITSFPGIGALTGARVLAEIGDDRSRFQDAKGLTWSCSGSRWPASWCGQCS